MTQYLSLEATEGFISDDDTKIKAVTADELLAMLTQPTTAVIRTSDRISFKACRRRWAWQSHMKGNREPRTAATPLWFGTGIHFALEDYHGQRIWDTPEKSFAAYVNATIASKRQGLPHEWREEAEMGVAMLRYYHKFWLPNRDALTTFVVDGRPQLEVNFVIHLPFDVRARYPDSPYTDVVYSGTIDRIVIEHATRRLWLVDYKTAKQLKQSHALNDPQVSAYCWAAQQLYPGYEIAGMIYWQFLKATPKFPSPLASGHISVNKNQRTSRPLYRHALVKQYGAVDLAPEGCRNYLESLTMAEGPDHDNFIRRDYLYKNDHSLEVEGSKILMELEDILNPNLPLYPNPTFMCPAMCPFFEPCQSMDDGSDWHGQLIAETQERSRTLDHWKAHLQYPEGSEMAQLQAQKQIEADAAANAFPT